MPSASLIQEMSATEKNETSLKPALHIIEKKIRNLEKRKSKLDQYKEKSAKGEQLNKDQTEAITKFDHVVLHLEFARDLLKQFSTIIEQEEKTCPKTVDVPVDPPVEAGEPEKVELIKCVPDSKRTESLLRIQGVLETLGDESVRQDFADGKNGAIKVSSEALEQLDGLYELIKPARSGETPYSTALSEAVSQIDKLIDGSSDEVIGTSYKDLKDLIDSMDSCGYLDNLPEAETAAELTGEVTRVTVENSLTDDRISPHSSELKPAVSVEQVIQNSSENSQKEEQQSTFHSSADHSYFNNNNYVNQQQTFMQQNVQQPAQQIQQQTQIDNKRPFHDIVSSVQGTFNFLQESTIERDYSRVQQQQQQPSSYDMFGGNENQSAMQALSLSGSSSTHSSHLTSVNQHIQHAHQQQQQQPAMSNFHHESKHHGPSEIPSQPINTGLATNVNGTCSDIPPPIEMPPIHSHAPLSSSVPENQTYNSDHHQEKKHFSMNPNANVFQSMLTNQSASVNPDVESQKSFSSQQPENEMRRYNTNRGGGGQRVNNNCQNRGSSHISSNNNQPGKNRNSDGMSFQEFSGNREYYGDKYHGDNCQVYTNSSVNYNANNYHQKRPSNQQRGGSRGGRGNYSGQSNMHSSNNRYNNVRSGMQQQA